SQLLYRLGAGGLAAGVGVLRAAGGVVEAGDGGWLRAADPGGHRLGGLARRAAGIAGDGRLVCLEEAAAHAVRARRGAHAAATVVLVEVPAQSPAASQRLRYQIVRYPAGAVA